MRVEQLTGPVTHHGEGAFWDGRGQRLLCVDMMAGDVLDLTDPGSPVRHHVGAVAAVVRARRDGGFVAATERSAVLLDEAMAVTHRGPQVLAGRAVRLNDGGCDPAGRFHCGSMAYDATPGAGVLLRFDADLAAVPVLEKVTISNGVQWSPDGTTALYTDTPTGRIDAYDVDSSTGAFTGRRPFARVPEGRGLPDGSCLDTEGGLWTALWGGSGVARFDADGALTDLVDVPTPQVTSCAFGGADGSTLFLTTSRQDLRGSELDHRAGAVFALPTGVAGAPVSQADL